jgi:hypothetical protein
MIWACSYYLKNLVCVDSKYRIYIKISDIFYISENIMIFTNPVLWVPSSSSGTTTLRLIIVQGLSQSSWRVRISNAWTGPEGPWPKSNRTRVGHSQETPSSSSPASSNDSASAIDVTMGMEQSTSWISQQPRNQHVLQTMHILHSSQDWSYPLQKIKFSFPVTWTWIFVSICSWS